MPEQSVGIDIGDGLLKAVFVHAVRGGYRVDLAQAIDISMAGGLSEAFKRLRETKDFSRFRVKLSLPAESVSFHNVRLPFGEKKKIRQTIAFELETLLPYSVDDCLIDYNIINKSKHSEILAAVVPRSAVKERISLLGEDLPEINTVTIGAVPVALHLLENGHFTGPGLLLDVGNGEATAIFVYREKIVEVRCYAFQSAGSDRKGSGGSEGGDDNSLKLCQDLANTLEFLKWGGIMEDGLSRIVLTGGGCNNRGIHESLASFFSLPIEVVDLATLDGIELTAEVTESWDPSVMNQALALAVYGYRKGRGFNFPLAELENKARQEHLSKAMKWGAAVFSLSLLLIALDGYLDYRYSRLRLDNVKKEINAVFKSSVPEVTRIVDPVQQFKVKIAETKKISSGIGGVDGSATVLDILKDISALAPQSTEFLITGFNLDNDRLVIKGTAINFDAVDVIKKELAKSKYLKSVQIGATSFVKQGDKVEFDLRMTAQR
jgi:general secretion pathway protein L